jgi:hypothetical protein
MPNNSKQRLLADAVLDPDNIERGGVRSLATRLSEPVTSRDVKNVAPPTARYGYRYAGRGRKTPTENWKRYTRGKQYEKNLIDC